MRRKSNVFPANEFAILRFAARSHSGKLCAMSLLRGISSLGCPDLSLEQTLALAARHGLAAVELRSLGGTTDLPAYFAQNYRTPAALRRAVAATPVRLVALDTSLHLVGATAREREELAALGEWGTALGVTRLRVFDGGREANGEEFAEAAATVRWWTDLARARGWPLELIVETHDSLLTAQAVTAFRAAVPGIGVLWDAHHTWRKGGEDPLATWRAIRSAVVHVHIKDSVPQPSARHPFTYVLPGDGGFPVTSLLAALRADNFAGPVSLEWEKLWHPYLPPLEAALRVAEERDWW